MAEETTASFGMKGEVVSRDQVNMDYRVKLVVWHLQVELTWNGVEVPQIAPLLCPINPYPISQIRSRLSLE